MNRISFTAMVIILFKKTHTHYSSSCLNLCLKRLFYPQINILSWFIWQKRKMLF